MTKIKYLGIKLGQNKFYDLNKSKFENIPAINIPETKNIAPAGEKTSKNPARKIKNLFNIYKYIATNMHLQEKYFWKH